MQLEGNRSAQQLKFHHTVAPITPTRTKVYLKMQLTEVRQQNSIQLNLGLQTQIITMKILKEILTQSTRLLYNLRKLINYPF